MCKFIEVTTTVATEEDADALANLALEQRLAACVQVSPCRSAYRWQGKIERSNEQKLVMKSHQGLYPALEKLLLENHPYDVPEILASPVLHYNISYQEWLVGELKVSGPADE